MFKSQNKTTTTGIKTSLTIRTTTGIAALIFSALEASSALAAGGVLTGKVELLSGNIQGESAEKLKKTPAIVYVTGYNEDPPAETVIVSQKNKTFMPGIMPITKGTTVIFENQDEIRHNVFSASEARKFDLGLTSPMEKPQQTFEKTGVIEVYCNVHPEMFGYLLVLPNRRYALTQSDGTYRIEGVRPGETMVHVWHILSKPEHQKIQVEEGKVSSVNWNLTLSGAVPDHMNKFGRPYRERKKY